MPKSAYYVDWEEDEWYGPEEVLYGPNGFMCVLGEPEDCCWSRDGAPVVDELNRLVARIKDLEHKLRLYGLEDKLVY